MPRKLTVHLNGAKRYDFVLRDGTKVEVIAGIAPARSTAKPTHRESPKPRTLAKTLDEDIQTPDLDDVADLFVPGNEGPTTGFTVPSDEKPVLGIRSEKK